MNRQRKPTLDEYIEAIVERDSGMSYAKVLETFEFTPNQFGRAITRILDNHADAQKSGLYRTLAEIASDESRRRELFNMGERFVVQQYDRIHGKIPDEEQKIFYTGTYYHPQNIRALVYHALTSDKPKLASPNRKVVIHEFRNLPSDLSRYLWQIGLIGLMVSCEEVSDSPHAVLTFFDEAYQQKTGDASLFDLTQKEHLHRWGGDFTAPQAYWKNEENVRVAIYHTLTEAKPTLKSIIRQEVIKEIKKLPWNLGEYFAELGLAGLMMSAFGKGKQDSPIAVLEVFDQVYQEKTGDVSLFDLEQEDHIHKWATDVCASRPYWQDRANVEEAVYHVLTENHPNLASTNREVVVRTLRELPKNLRDYFFGIGLRGLMAGYFNGRKKNSPVAVLEVFSDVYQKKTGDNSLFDEQTNCYLQIDGLHRIKRVS